MCLQLKEMPYELAQENLDRLYRRRSLAARCEGLSVVRHSMAESLKIAGFAGLLVFACYAFIALIILAVGGLDILLRHGACS